MCGRFAQVFVEQDLEHIERILLQATGVDQGLIEMWSETYPVSKPAYNIAPTQYASIIHTPSTNRTSLTQAHFGLIPSWAKDRSRSSSMINARSETIKAKPAYREVFRSRRCLLPINGFYEWQKLTSKIKQPWYIYRADGEPMLLAGVCDTWLDPDHGHCEVDSFSLITTTANEFMSDLHHRMPVVVEPEAVNSWFDPAAEVRELEAQMTPAMEGVLMAHRISKRVNSPDNNDPALMELDSDASPSTLWG